MSIGLWAGACEAYEDDITVPVSGTATASTNKYPFCSATYDENEEWDFDGVLGFGRHTSWDAVLQYTYIGRQYYSDSYKP